MFLRPEESFLVVIDPQEKLLGVVWEASRVVKNIALLLRAAKEFEVPVVPTTQYRKGLGEYPEDLRSLLSEEPLDKVEFSVFNNSEIRQKIAALGKKKAILCGVETHICVYQTALSAQEAGYEVVVVADATSSRTPENMRYGLRRMEALGMAVVSTEMLIYEWLHKAGTPAFKALLPYLK